ncbi:hypothetical protein [Candidatus Entotheonella palauensis]|uniref:hypothetical protein n=1 Tax=Candidatus Entotheonella palauensis TaxID=93172 RepID=UPI0004BBA2A0|nr:hypothetical protein [Candidatus Entotheonella palauensis]
MSAISGLYHLDQLQADTAALGAMMRALQAFGPDGMQGWHRGPVTFLQARWRERAAYAHMRGSRPAPFCKAVQAWVHERLRS